MERPAVRGVVSTAASYRSSFFWRILDWGCTEVGAFVDCLFLLLGCCAQAAFGERAWRSGALLALLASVVCCLALTGGPPAADITPVEAISETVLVHTVRDPDFEAGLVEAFWQGAPLRS